MASSMKTAVLGFAAGVVSVQAFKSILIESVQASFEHERAMRATAFALENTGEIANISVKGMDAWAEALQQATGVSSDFILRSTNLAITMGASAEVAQKMTTAALDFAAATGRDANQAVNQLVKTLGGYAGELAEILPQVKQLTASQLKAGEAADIMAQLVGGAALDMRQTTAGSFQAMKEDLVDLKQEIGNVVADVAQAPQKKNVFRLLADDLADFNRGLKELDASGLDALTMLLHPASFATALDLGKQTRATARADAFDSARRAQVATPGFQQPPGRAPFAPGPALDLSDPGQRFTNILDELKLLKSRDEDPIAIFRELARAYSPDEAFKLAIVTKTLTEAIELRIKAEGQAKTAAEGVAFAGPTQADFDRQDRFDAFDAQFMDFMGPPAPGSDESKRLENLEKEKKLIVEAGESRNEFLKREHSDILSLSTTVGGMFIDGIRGAQELGDTLTNIFNAVIDSLAEAAARKLGFEIAAFAVSFIPGVGPVAGEVVRTAGRTTSQSDDGTTILTEKQAQRAIARWVLPEQRKADARGL